MTLRVQALAHDLRVTPTQAHSFVRALPKLLGAVLGYRQAAAAKERPAAKGFWDSKYFQSLGHAGE